jgi:hypothetical protein
MACGTTSADTSAPTDGISGFGATTATWASRHHVLTTDFHHECQDHCQNRFYDRQPGGVPHFDVVGRDHDRIVWLDVEPVPVETQEQLLTEIKSLLPQDAVQIDAGQQPECATVQFTSEILAEAFRNSGLRDADGLVALNLIDVVFFSGHVLPSGHSPPYTPTHVTEAQIHLGYPGSAKETAC